MKPRALTDFEGILLQRICAGESPYPGGQKSRVVEQALDKLEAEGMWTWRTFVMRELTAKGTDALKAWGASK